jgi:PTS system mannose-specific IIA component
MALKVVLMKNGILIIAHAPLASALRQCVLHVFPDSADKVGVFDVQPHVPPEETLAGARQAMALLNAKEVLVLTDILGATPCNVAQKLIDGISSRMVAGVNLPMLLRAVTYSHEALESMVTRAMAGGTQGVISISAMAPQNQLRKTNDQDDHDHQQ